MKITFNYEAVPAFKWKAMSWKYWLRNIALEEEVHIAELSYIFTSDDFLLQLNKEKLQHDDYTDIITFDLSDEDAGSPIEGEIFISVERVLDNAKQFEVSFETELARVMAHGVLHLCGYKDKKPAEIKAMRAKEDYYIASSPAMLP